MIRPIVHLSLAAALLGTVSAAWAQPPKTLSEALEGSSRDAYASARILFGNGDFAGALIKFRQAYEASRDPRLLYNMAVCEKAQRHYARMEALLRQYEREQPSMPSDEKQAVDGTLAAAADLVGSVTVLVDAPGATVAVDGESAGTTPLPRPLIVDLGPHKVSVTKDGFDPSEKTVDVPGGGDATVAVSLTPHVRMARLVVSTDGDAIVSIDGTAVAKARFDGHTAAGAHRILVTAAGMRPFTADIDLRDGETRTLQVALEGDKRAEAPVWPWVAGGAALAAGVVVGGYFLFKGPGSSGSPAPTGQLGSLTFSGWRFR